MVVKVLAGRCVKEAGLGRGRGFGLGKEGERAVSGASMSIQLICCTDLAGLKVAAKVLDPAVSLSRGAAREAAAPAGPRYLLETGFKGEVEAKHRTKGSG